MLQSERLFLMPATQPMLDAFAGQNWNQLSSLLGGVSFADNWCHFPEALLWVKERMEFHPEESGWWTYFIIQGLDGRVAGTCGYKGLPTPDGTVEIGYEIAERYQNDGLATEAADALVRHAFRHPQVMRVIAHTLPELNASTAVLSKLGFTNEGEHTDIHDGQVWRWSLARPDDQFV